MLEPTVPKWDRTPPIPPTQRLPVPARVRAEPDRAAVRTRENGVWPQLPDGDERPAGQWPRLPDDAALWTVPAPLLAAEHVTRLEREQAGA
jgi:hypothetical protein